MFKVNNKDTRMTLETSLWCLYCSLYFIPFSSVSIVNTEQVKACCEFIATTNEINLKHFLKFFQIFFSKTENEFMIVTSPQINLESSYF